MGEVAEFDVVLFHHVHISMPAIFHSGSPKRGRYPSSSGTYSRVTSPFLPDHEKRAFLTHTTVSLCSGLGTSITTPWSGLLYQAAEPSMSYSVGVLPWPSLPTSLVG